MRGIGPIESVQLKLHERSGWHTVAKVLAINVATSIRKGRLGGSLPTAELQTVRCGAMKAAPLQVNRAAINAL